MKILVDENIPLLTVGELRIQGFDVTDIRGTDNLETTARKYTKIPGLNIDHLA